MRWGARAIALFAARVLAWGVPLFAAWYLATAPLSIASGWVAARLAELAMPVDRVPVRYRGGSLVFDAEPDEQTLWRNRLPAAVALEARANPMQFTCSIPFFLALVLATSLRPAWRRTVMGAGVLLLLASAGLYFDVHLQLAQVPGPGGGPLFATGPLAREAIALGFQLSTLLVPVLAPIVLWAAGEGRTRILPGREAGEGG
ncbi:MAG TPA: exosortase H-associated membrane protein [Usitatibacter sp.]|nr:exosortase H-associated membrane protein [Usitatibacter sp.]